MRWRNAIYCIMNENEINVLLDFFVGGLDSTESANVTQKINSHPLWSKTYNQLSRVFSSLDTIKKQNSQQPLPSRAQRGAADRDAAGFASPWRGHGV